MSQPHRDALIGHERLGLAHRVFTKVEDAGSQHSIGAPFRDAISQVLKRPHTP